MFKCVRSLFGLYRVVNAHRGAWVVCAAALLVLLPTLARAGTQSYGGVTVNVEPPPEVTSYYGYAVYRITVINRDKKPHNVTVTLPADSWTYGDSIERLSRTVRVEAGSTAVAELLQPPLPMNGSDARVQIDGQNQRSAVPLSVANHADQYDGQPILLSRNVSGLIGTKFESALTEVDDEFGGYSRSLAAPVRADRPVNEWSSNWLAYSRYLMVWVSDEELRDAPQDVDSALRDYVASGGTLVVLGKADTLPTLGPAWTEATSLQYTDQYGVKTLQIGLGEVQLQTISRVTRFKNEDWAQLINQTSSYNRQRENRMEAYDAERRLPMLEALTVPTRGLLAIMLLFTLLILPGNVLLLSWLKRRMWLLWTIPMIAFIFAGAVLAYSIFSEGISPRAKTVSITLLDQNTHQAVTLGFTGYYAPLTPSDGLHFSERTLVTPQVGYYDEYDFRYNGRSRTMDQTNGQHLSRGWIVARVPAHFDLRCVESRRERLDITRTDKGELLVVNGLGLPIKRLLVTDSKGELFEINNLAAGNSATASKREWNTDTTESVPQMFTNYDVLNAANQINNDPERILSNAMYVAILDNASYTEPGLSGIGEHETTGIVIGRWEGAE